MRATVPAWLLPLCETLAEARFSLAPSRVESWAPRLWGRKLGETQISSQRAFDGPGSCGLNGRLCRESCLLPSGDPLLTDASLPMGTPSALHLTPTPHPIHSPCSQLSVPALPVVRADIGRWLVAPEKQLEAGGQGETTTGALVLPMGKQKAGGQPVAWCTAGWREGMQAYEFCHRGSKKQPHHRRSEKAPEPPAGPTQGSSFPKSVSND